MHDKIEQYCGIRGVVNLTEGYNDFSKIEKGKII